jgi:hypothetical protein
MKYKERIYEAWEFTQRNKKMIIWYGFIPALLTTLAGILYVGYQIMAFKKSPLFDNAQHSFGYDVVTTIFNFFQENVSISVPIIVTLLILGIIYLLLPPLLDVAMIQVIARRRNGQPATLTEGIKYGLLRFLPFFEYSLLIRTFSFISISAEAAFIIRNFGVEAFQALSPVIIIIAIIAFIIHLLFTFAEYYIVIDDEGVMSSIVKSSTLVILNLQKTFMLLILMLIIAIRIIIQVILVIIIPAIIFIAGAYFASTSLPEYALYILGALSFVFLLFASYLAAIVHIFAVSVWTFTFLDFTSEQHLSAREQLDAEESA